MIAQALAGASALLLSVVGWVVGGRLLLLARRTRQLPELALGLDFFLIGAVGYPLAIASNAFSESSRLLPAVLAMVGSITASHLGMLAHYFFTRTVFRPRAGWAGLLVAACALAAVIGFAGSVHLGLGWLHGGSRDATSQVGWTLFLIGVAILTCIWSAAESFAYYGKARRRLALGLVEPIVANRLLLWGIHSSATAIGSVVNAYFALTSPLSVLDPVALTFAGFCGGTGAVCVLLGFMPPAWYRRFVDARYAARSTRAPRASGTSESERAA